MHLCHKLLCAKAFCAQWFVCARNFSLTVRAFWRAEQLRWVEKNLEMRKVDQCYTEIKTVEKNLLRYLRWHVRRDAMRWEELRWGERRWEEVTGGEKRWEELTWFEMRWSVECEVHVWREVRDVKIAVWSVRKVLAWRCIAPGSCAGHGLGQQPRNSFAQSTRARAWLSHGACKFYRLHRFYSISLRLLVYGFTCMVPAWYPVQLDSWNFYHYFRDPSLLVTVTSKEGSLVTLSWGISFPKKYDFWEYTE